VLSGTGLTVTALAQHLVVLHVGFGLLFGVASGLAYSSVVTWASTRTAPGATGSVGLVVAAYAAGPVIAGPVVGVCSAQWGWRATVHLGAAVVAVLTVLASRLLPDAPVGARPTHGPTVHRTAPAASAALWLLLLCAAVPGLFAFAYAAELAAQRGLAQRLGGLAVAAMGMGNLLGRLAADPLIARVGLRAALRIDLVSMGVALVALASLSGQAAALLTLVLLATQYGALSALLPTAVRRVCDASRFGSTYGLVFSAWGLAGVLAPRLHDPAATDGAALGPWVVLTVVAIASLGVYERLSTQHRP
jgi:MFS family permease